MQRSAEYWDKVHLRYALQDWIEKPTIFATQVVKYFPQNGKLLDLGAGQGQDSFFFASQGYEVVVADFSKKALDLAKKRAPVELSDKLTFEEVDMSNPLPYNAESFDVVYSHLGLHYFDTPRTQALFDEIYMTLKPGGIFATLTNSIHDPEFGQGEQIEKQYYSDLQGVSKRYFSVDTMKEFTSKFETILLDNAGETYKDVHKTLIRFVGKKLG